MELYRAYEIFNLPYGSSLEDVKRSYRVVLQQVNLDRKPSASINKRVLAEERFKAIIDAYHTIIENPPTEIIKSETQPPEAKPQLKQLESPEIIPDISQLTQPVALGEPTRHRSASEKGAGCFLIIGGVVVLYTILFFRIYVAIFAVIIMLLCYLLFKIIDRIL